MTHTRSAVMKSRLYPDDVGESKAVELSFEAVRDWNLGMIRRRGRLFVLSMMAAEFAGVAFWTKC